MNRKGMLLADNEVGLQWIGHIESYADTPFRITQGRHLYRIGSLSKKTVSPFRCEAEFDDSEKAIVSIEELNETERNTLSSELGKIILDGGVAGETKIEYPSRERIHSECTCGDCARLCKHSVAVLISLTDYGSKDLITFLGLDMDLIENRVVQDSIDVMLSNADKQSDRFLDSDKVKKLFGV